MRDKLGRNINYIRISVTDRCNLRCRYCMPEEGIEKKSHTQMLSLEEIYEVVAACTELGIDKVRITGGEPLIKKGLMDLIYNMGKLPGLRDIGLTTNGLLLAQYAEALKTAGLKRVNISLDTLDTIKYKEITRGGNIKEVFDGIEAARKAGLTPIKLNTVLIGGFNDDEIIDFVNLTKEQEIDIRFIELMPIGQASGWAKKNFIPNTTILDKVKALEPVQSDDPCSPAKYFKLPHAKGRVGLINPISHQFCGDCNRIRLTADGKLKPCLHSNIEFDVKSITRDETLQNRKEQLKTAIIEAISAKPDRHGLNEADNKPIERDMFRIGG